MAKKPKAESKKAPEPKHDSEAVEVEVVPQNIDADLEDEPKVASGEDEQETLVAIQSEVLDDETTAQPTPLTKQERARFIKLEKQTLTALSEARKSSISAIQSMRQIRDEKLFREDYPTFEEYCEKKLGFSKRFINYQINYAQVVANLEQGEHPVPVFPTSESQVRSLGSLKAETQSEVWLKAVEIAEGNVPSREIVTEAVRTYRNEQSQKKKRNTQNGKKRTIKAGDCIRVKGIPTTELSAFRNWWGFVQQVTDEGYTIELPHKVIPEVKATDISLDTVEGTPLTKQQTESRRKLFARLVEIYNQKEKELEKGSEQLLEYLLSYFVTLELRARVNKEGKKSRSVKLTSFEEKVLSLIESQVQPPESNQT